MIEQFISKFFYSISRNVKVDSPAQDLGAFYESNDGTTSLDFSHSKPPLKSLELLVYGWLFFTISEESKAKTNSEFRISESYDDLVIRIRQSYPASNIVKSKLHKIIKDLREAAILEIIPSRSEENKSLKPTKGKRDRPKRERLDQLIKGRPGRPIVMNRVLVDALFSASIYPWFLFTDIKLVGYDMDRAIEILRLTATEAKRVASFLEMKINERQFCECFFSFHLACLEDRYPELRFQKVCSLEPNSLRAGILKKLLMELGSSPDKVEVFGERIKVAKNKK